ncbi:MAG TPA: T9SS type A sorting domain-containing protein, partial [Bacteroidia bacterium]
IMSPGAPYSDMVAVKLNSTGGLEWNKVITLGTAQNYAYSIKQAPDSTYVLNALIENYPPYDACDALIKLSSAGNIIWAKKYNQSTPVTTSPVDIEIVPSGIISFLSVSNSVAVMKTDFSGNVLWDKKYSIYSNPSGCMNCLKTKIHSTADGGYIVINGGQFSSYVAQIFRIDSTGNELWAKDVFFYGQDIALAGDKGYAILGNGPIYGVERSALGTYNDQIGLVKLDSLGNGISCLSSMGTSSSSANLIPTSISPTQTTGGSISALHPVIISTSLLVDPGCVAMLGNIDQNSATPITVSPNPSAGQFLFSGINAENTIEITDVLGKTIFRTTASHEQLELDISSKAKGIYFYRIRDKQKLLQQGKIVLQ